MEVNRGKEFPLDRRTSSIFTRTIIHLETQGKRSIRVHPLMETAGKKGQSCAPFYPHTPAI